MVQFPPGQLLSDLARCGQLAVNEIDQIIGIVANFHETIEKADEQSPYGHSEEIKHWFVENFEHIRPLLDDEHHKQQLQAIQAWGDGEWNKNRG